MRVWLGNVLTNLAVGSLFIAVFSCCGGALPGSLIFGLMGVGLMYAAYVVKGGRLNPELHDEDILDKLLTEGSPDETKRMVVAVCLIRIALGMAAADGHIDDTEVEAIRDFFRQNGADAEWMHGVDLILVNSSRHVDIERSIRLVLERTSKDEREVILLALIQVAVADGHVSENEIGYFAGIASAFGFTEAEIMSMLGLEPEGDDGPSRRDAALATLGLTGDPPSSDIRKAYREMAKRYHPDRVAHLGPEFVEVARKRMQEVNEAYSLLKGTR